MKHQTEEERREEKRREEKRREEKERDLDAKIVQDFVEECFLDAVEDELDVFGADGASEMSVDLFLCGVLLLKLGLDEF